jgi:hypothetical protein
MAEARRIIYVDAGQNEDKEFQIALYDKQINLTSIIKLIDINNNNIAEKYAILNAITYIQANCIKNAIILSDCTGAVNDKHFVKLCETYKLKLSWIPREINEVADKVAKLNPTKKDDTFYTLHFIYTLIFPTKEQKTTACTTKETTHSNAKIIKAPTLAHKSL